jgi:hypothetical protein
MQLLGDIELSLSLPLSFLWLPLSLDPNDIFSNIFLFRGILMWYLHAGHRWTRSRGRMFQCVNFEELMFPYEETEGINNKLQHVAWIVIPLMQSAQTRNSVE